MSKYEQHIKDRVLETAAYFLKNNSTIRDTAKVIGVGKSTVHKDLTEKLKNIDCITYKEVRNLLNKNIEVRHIRGGLSTQRKYKHSTNLK